jgi:hypothetical protein
VRVVRRHGTSACLALLAVIGVTRSAAAQEPLPGSALTTCSGQRIDEITFVSMPARFRAKVPDFVPNASGVQRVMREAQDALWSATKVEAIRPFMLLQEGDACSERRRAESERLLRSQPYIADAAITVYETGPGHVSLIVETSNELSIIADFGVSGRSPYLTRARLGNPNLFGYGTRAVLTWRDGNGFRDGYQFEMTKWAAFGQPVVVSLNADHAPVGGGWGAALSRPFQTDFQRFAWSASASERRSYVGLLRADTVPVGLDVTRRQREISGAARIGPPGELLLIGASFSTEAEETGHQPVEFGRGVLNPVTDSALVSRYSATHTVRLNALLAYRELKYFRATGFDVVEGLQDVRTGIEVGGSLGRGIRGWGSDDRDWFTTAGLFLGAGNQTVYGYFNGLAEGRYQAERQYWDAIITSGRAQGYWRFTPGQTLVSQLEWSAGERMRVPFQLNVTDRLGGLRGFERSRDAGGERLVFRLEDRIYTGRVKNVAAVALAPFLDVGRIWRGDAPYGRTTPVLASAGLAVIGALPPQSQLSWRAELGVRMTPDPYAGRFMARIIVRDNGRRIWREPGDITRSRPTPAVSNILSPP